MRHAAWPALLADLTAHKNVPYLRDVPAPVACAVLAAPVAIARWIAARAPELACKPALSLLVIGAETTDAPDQGRWYQLLPQLLDARCAVALTLIGPELDPAFASSAAAQAPPMPARCARVTLGEFLAQNERPQFDLAMVFHPGLQKHQNWLADGGFARLMTAGVPLMASSYESDEFEMDRWVLECFGYRASAEPLLNPYFLELGEERARVRWGRALWQVEAAPTPGHAVDKPRLAALDNLTRMVMHSMNRMGEPSPGYGVQAELEARPGARVPVIHVFDNRFVEMASGRLWHLAANGALQECGRVSPDVLLRYPGAAAPDLERAVWAAEVKSQYLLDSYPRHPPADAAAATARGMLAAMRDKAAALFRK